MTVWDLQQKIHTAVKEKLCIGMTENQLADIITEVCPNWQGDLISGKRTSEIEGGPTDKVIGDGDVVLLDLQVCLDEQWSDLTRVYFVGGTDDEKTSLYKRVVDALKAGEELLFPGTRVCDIWHKMREVIGTEYAFTHHGGHRIGKDNIVDIPRFVPECEDTLKKGMIVTLEPGVYIPQKFGIRLENNYLITEDGYRLLSGLSLDMKDYILKG